MSENITSSDLTMEHEDHSSISTRSDRHPVRKRKPRMKWCYDLHSLFINAANNLGGPYLTTPTAIIQYMGVLGLDASHVKSHLQMYRLQMGTQAVIAKFEARLERKRNRGRARVQPTILRNTPRYGTVRRGGLIHKNKFVPLSDLRNLFQEVRPNRRVYASERLQDLRRQLIPQAGDSTVNTESVDSNIMDDAEISVCTCLGLHLKLSTWSDTEVVESEEREREMSGEDGDLDLTLSLAPPKGHYPDLSKFK